MSKRELIDAIIRHNHSAAPEFLAKFAESDLKAYLERVCQIRPQPTMRRSADRSAKSALLMA